MCATLHNLFGASSSRKLRTASTRLRPSLTQLEDRWVLSPITPFVVDNLHNSGPGSLRAAIEKANQRRGPQTIEFSNKFDEPKTIRISGQLDITDNGLTIIGPAGGVTINAHSESRVLVLEQGAGVHMSNVNIVGGFADNDYGGGVYNRGDLTLTHCVIDGDRATALKRFPFGNTSYGGGVYNASTATLTMLNCTVENDKVEAKGQPGSLANVYGGGIANYGGIVNLMSCTFSGNQSDGYGGAFYNYGTSYMTNCTFSGNATHTDFRKGGALYNQGDASLVSCTFTKNAANKGYGGGIYCYNSLDIWNTIVALNTAGRGNADVYGTFHSGGPTDPATGGHNLIGSTTGSNGFKPAPTGTDQAGNALKPVVPKLGDLSANGGFTKTVPLLEGSIGINQGAVYNIAGTNDPVTTDQRGLPLDNPPDIGAFQIQRT
jgi:predicted outer membrane repeat protein